MVSRAGEVQHTRHPVGQSRSVVGGSGVARGIFFCHRCSLGEDHLIDREEVGGRYTEDGALDNGCI